MRARDLKRWRSGDAISYAFGAFAVLQLLAARPTAVRLVVVDPAAQGSSGADQVQRICADRDIEVVIDARTVRTLSGRGNAWVMAAFAPWQDTLDDAADHVLLVRPADPGNLGTIVRTMTGLGLHDLAVVPPGVDTWDPRVVRASMGARFGVRATVVTSAAEYARRHGARTLYPFLTDGTNRLGELTFAAPATLVFGPEAAGLDAADHQLGPGVVIPATGVDSFNLAVAAALGLWELHRDRRGPPADTALSC